MTDSTIFAWPIMEDVNLRFIYEEGLGMTTLRDQYSKTIEALDELSEEELEPVYVTMDIVFTDTGERINICEAPIKQFFSAFGGMMDLSDIGNCSNEEFESIFDSLGIDINPELLSEAEVKED